MNSSEVHPIPLEQLQQGVFPIITVAGDAQWHTVGTAFVIAVPEPKVALLLTAAHNLRFIQRIDMPQDRHHPTVVPEFHSQSQSWVNLSDTYVYLLARNGTTGALAEMVRSWCMDAFDVALMLVRIGPDDDIDFPYRFALDSRPIAADTPIMAVGYPRMRAYFTAPPNYETQDFRCEVALQLQTRVGKVVRVCPQGAGINRWPGFLVDTSFDSGMSGGPVIDLSGAVPLVRGLVGADMSERLEDGAQGSGVQAFASMIWPAMITETQLAFIDEHEHLVVPGPSRLLALVRHGIVDDHGRAHQHVRFRQTATHLEYAWIAMESEP
jgi:hypothetical protein